MNQEEFYNKAGKAFSAIVAKVSYMIWEKMEFRELIDFDKISQTEQDRIFNELEVSLLGLFYLYLDNLSAQLKDQAERKITQKLRDSLKRGFLNMYSDYGVEGKYVEVWEKLIDLRFKEYQKDFKFLMKNGSKLEELKDEKLRLFWARNQVITLDCLQHIRRGNLDHKDPLKKYLQDFVVSIDKIYSESIKELIFDPKAIS